MQSSTTISHYMKYYEVKKYNKMILKFNKLIFKLVKFHNIDVGVMVSTQKNFEGRSKICETFVTRKETVLFFKELRIY